MRVLCKDCKYYVVEKSKDERHSEEEKVLYQKYLCSHPDTVHPVNGDYCRCCSVREKDRECGVDGELFKKIIKN